MKGFLIVATFCLVASCSSPPRDDNGFGDHATAKSDPLPSWREGEVKRAILDFVGNSVDERSSGFIPERDRIACFDNDGTLWSEQPFYFQLAFAFDRIRTLAPEHPEWRDQEPFKAILERKENTVLAEGEHALVKVLATTHAGMTTDEFEKAVSDWMATAVHPKTGRRYNEMIYQPMVELLDYLEANGYKTFIVSGGGADFMRAWTEETYGIPPERVVGSSGKVKFESQGERSWMVKLPEPNFVDDGVGKPVGIHQHIGKRPVFSAGNSDGDYAMLQWTTTATGYPRFGLIVHHTDDEREWAYDRDSPVGRLDKGLDAATQFRWKVVDMERDWARIYPTQPANR